MPVSIFDGDVSEELAALLRGQPAVAVDTETSGLDPLVDRLLLVQLYTDATGPILVRTAAAPPRRLLELLADASIEKVFHFAPFDLGFLAAQWGVRAESVGCTKTASKLVDPHFPANAHSLMPLVARELGVHLDKGEVRTSDWGATALTRAQVEYATADVAHLLQLKQRLEQRLRDVGRMGLYREVCRYLPVDALIRAEGLPDPLRY